jgi:carboxyvinyl-carboxyphosphonate phosphorylmutase
VDAVFLAGVEQREQLDAVAEAIDIPIFLARVAPALADLDYLGSRRVRVALQGHLPFMAAIQAVHDTLGALRKGVPPADIPGVASDEMVKRLSHDRDYRQWSKEFLGN